MITELRIRNFKRFADTTLRLAPLTVLTGCNGTGKSTAVQSLLLARQVAEDDGASVAQLNGPYGLALGEAWDVLHPEAERQEIEIRLRAEHAEYAYRLEIPDNRALHLPIRERPEQHPPALIGSGASFTYLTAERLGPRDQLSVTSEEQDKIGVGEQGQYTAQALAVHDTARVGELLRHPDTSEHGVTTLRTQVEEWTSEIVRPIRITAQWAPGLTASVIRFQNPGVYGEQLRPQNMGFGVSYALPIIVAGLLMKPGGLLIVENPEAHLHPAGQSRLGRYLGRVAGNGAQVIVETHSDHVLNGIRLATVEDETVASDDVLVHFFGQESDEPTPIDLTARGGLTTWPEGFFDQIETDLGRLARAKRRNR